ncbi:hypothetical protein BDA99DRAFT_543492 [Phascolomyces articulosus]|uniref:Uncharacterized protein n=1 Tax=Phascolomyces articulosus TaxID=60185 RepID=A0AAD5P7W8_9FUNG|nr:hypothetical protein BDA99DRAFT_543492 [Phascolomyces articulosus]
MGDVDDSLLVYKVPIILFAYQLFIDRISLAFYFTPVAIMVRYPLCRVMERLGTRTSFTCRICVSCFPFGIKLSSHHGSYGSEFKRKKMVTIDYKKKINYIHKCYYCQQEVNH